MSIQAFLTRRKQTQAEAEAAALAAYRKALHEAASRDETLTEKQAGVLVELSERAGHFPRLETDLASIKKYHAAKATAKNYAAIVDEMTAAYAAKRASEQAIRDAERADTAALIHVGAIQRKLGDANDCRTLVANLDSGDVLFGGVSERPAPMSELLVGRVLKIA